MLKPILLIVMSRRYYELEKNLPRMVELAKEELPSHEVVVVWSEPNVGHLWIFQRLIKQGKIQHLLTRQPDAPGRSISYNCSRDLRVGLDFIRKTYQNCYVIAHCADVCPKQYVYANIDGAMQAGRDAYLVILPNSVVRQNAWHTNFFAVSLNEAYWPPVIERNEDPDILEVKWGKRLVENKLENIDYTGNMNHKTFSHLHESETQPGYVEIAQEFNGGLNLFIKGHKTILMRLKEWLKSLQRLIPKKKPAK